MKLAKVLLRWYKSFHLNYRGYTDRGQQTSWRPWNSLAPDFAPNEEFPFIEIPIEPDITTIVGANESGKSHLLNAVSKVVVGVGIDGEGAYQRTDLCHYAGVRTKNVEACPNIGLLFDHVNTDVMSKIQVAAGLPTLAPSTPERTHRFALVLTSDYSNHPSGVLYTESSVQAHNITGQQLEEIRTHLPAVEFIDSKALLSSEIPINQLIAAYEDKQSDTTPLIERKNIDKAVKAIQSFALTLNSQITQETIDRLKAVKDIITSSGSPSQRVRTLELLLFRDILGITKETLEYVYRRGMKDRGYIEGQIAKWNEEISDKLNLQHFWRQDEQFSLRVNYKDAILYFEIQDKTESIYTFQERSSGLKYFLSYYIQAKAMEMSSRNWNSIILMDEPDSALSILGQRNLLAIFESLVSAESSSQTCQLIYTTHSPYLINRNFARRIRVVKKEDAEEGTQYIEQARTRRYEPVRTALGIDSAPSLFLGLQNVLLEGPTDQYLIAEFVRVFSTPENVGDFLDLNSIVLVSADGVGNVENVLAQSRWGDEPIPPTVVLLDGDEAGKEMKKKLSSSTAKKIIEDRYVALVSDLIKPFGDNKFIATVEDIIPAVIYTSAICNYIKQWLPQIHKDRAAWINEKLSSKDYSDAGLVAATQSLFRELSPPMKGDYDKMGVLQEVVKMLDPPAEKVSPDDREQLKKNIKVICDYIRLGLDESQSAHTTKSATQGVKRVIYDFLRLNKDAVPITSIQRIVRRIEREIALVGDDATKLAELMKRYLKELDALRGAGQERITGTEWATWEGRLNAIKKNPLNPIEVSQPTAALPGNNLG